ncbi:gustatory and pheromone receptor 39a-like [Rhodnius prolixus]|uniref:gustatory and pheromone receptor 39a-like n=1 Tax=Rhodnius prolixus TaxID=13249 RepID=UPI003D18830F
MKKRFPIRLAIELAYMIGLCALEVTVSFPSTDAGLAALLFINMYHGFTSPKVMIDRYTRHINGVASRFSEATNKLQQGEYITEITAHSKLISSASQVSTVFGLEILLVLSIESCLIVYNLYNFRPLLEDFQKDNKSTSIFIFISILWLISWFSDVWHIISTTEEMLNQSKSFNETLLRQIIEDPTAELDKQEKVKLHIAMKKEVIITAFGFFTIDGTFLHNLAAVATTYLVILTQFKGKGPSKTAVEME